MVTIHPGLNVRCFPCYKVAFSKFGTNKSAASHRIYNIHLYHINYIMIIILIICYHLQFPEFMWKPHPPQSYPCHHHQRLAFVAGPMRVVQL